MLGPAEGRGLRLGRLKWISGERMDRLKGKAPQAPARSDARESYGTAASGGGPTNGIDRDDLPRAGWRRMAGLRLRPGDDSGPA
jgi:hypothetical protein